MGGLKDQLLKSGLVNEKQVKKAQQEKRKEENRKQAPQKQAEAQEEQQRRQQSLAEKAERDRLLNLQVKEEADKKALAAQARQLIETHRLPKADWESHSDEAPFNFQDGGRVKRLRIADPVRARIARGQCAIVKLDQRYEIVPADIAERIRQRDPAAVVLHNPPPQAAAPEPGDDPYADYQVPDDLMW
jgi:uncharacterized protein YaiL (DUF2058 family)